MGGAYNLVNLALYHYAGNNPVKYTDPDGRAAQLVIPVGVGASLGTIAGISCLALIGTGSLILIAQKADEISKDMKSPQEHHSFPIFLGGDVKQKLVPMEKSRHVNLHKDLRGFLQDHYPSLEPKRGNSGDQIIAKNSTSTRLEAMSRFYLTHLDAYADAALQFFTDHPEQFNTDNLQWANDHAVGTRIGDYIWNVLREETPE